MIIIIFAKDGAKEDKEEEYHYHYEEESINEVEPTYISH